MVFSLDDEQLLLFDVIEADRLRDDILDLLVRQGFTVTENGLTTPDLSVKENVRRLHARFRLERLQRAKKAFAKKEVRLLKYFADGKEIDVEAIRPEVVVVNSTLQRDLFRYATLNWSVPVGDGYGRRRRFLVFDKSIGKLLGVFSVADPVFAIRVRDEWIGWTKEQKKRRLRHVRDINVLGAVPPYSYLLGGKLVAMLTTADEVRQLLPETPVLLTTTSALGRSSIYNRIKLGERTLFIRIGYTGGWGTFHFGDQLFERMKWFLRRIGDPISLSGSLNEKRSWKLRLIARCLYHLGLPPELLRHGARREVYVVPLAENAREFLRGETDTPVYYSAPMEAVWEFFRSRWLLPRAERDQRYRQFVKEELCLSSLIEQCRSSAGL